MKSTVILIFLLVATLYLVNGQNEDAACGYAYCQNGGKCLEETDRIFCQCQPGFVGLYCDLKVELSNEEDHDASDPVDDGDSESLSDDDSHESESKENDDPDYDENDSKEHSHSHEDKSKNSKEHSHSHEDKSKHSKEHRHSHEDKNNDSKEHSHSHEDKSKDSKEHRQSHEDKNNDSHISSHSHENPEEVDPCTSILCYNGGTCMSEGDVYRCMCAPEYFGPDCSHRIGPARDLCEDNTCPKNQMCVSMMRDMISCECLPGFIGEDCSTSIYNTKCQRERQLGMNPPGGRTDAFIPECDTNGNYLPTQCGMVGCWCVDQWGSKTIPGGNSFLDYEFVCVETKCERERRESTIPNLADNYIPSCDEQGNYLPLQCTYGSCWCVAVNGDRVSDFVWFGKPLKCEDVKKPYKVDISFKIQKNFSYIENNLSEFTNVILEYLMKHTGMTSDFIDNIALSSGSILVDLNLVERNQGYRDVMAYSVMISEMVSQNEVVFEFQGQFYPVDNNTLTMDFDGELITCYAFPLPKSKLRMGCLAAGGLILIAIALVSLGIYRRCRRNRFNNLHQVALKNDYLVDDCKKQGHLSFIQIPLTTDEKKIDLGREPGVISA